MVAVDGDVRRSTHGDDRARSARRPGGNEFRASKRSRLSHWPQRRRSARCAGVQAQRFGVESCLRKRPPVFALKVLTGIVKLAERQRISCHARWSDRSAVAALDAPGIDRLGRGVDDGGGATEALSAREKLSTWSVARTPPVKAATASQVRGPRCDTCAWRFSRQHHVAISEPRPDKRRPTFNCGRGPAWPRSMAIRISKRFQSGADTNELQRYRRAPCRSLSALCRGPIGWQA